MSVYKIKKSPYYQYDFVLHGQRYTGTTGVSDERKAKAVEKKKRAEAALRQDRKVIPTLDQAAGRWFIERGASLGTADEVERRLAVAVSLVGPNLLINKITGDHIATAVTRRKEILHHGKPPAPATVNRDIVDCLRPVFRRASRVWQVPAVHDIPWGDLREKEPKIKARSYSPSDIRLLFDALPERWHGMGRFAARYGCRLEELFFAPSALDIEGRRVTLRDRKGDDDHTIPLLAEDIDLLAALKGRAQAAGLPTIWFRELKSGRLKALAYWGAQKSLWARHDGRRVARDHRRQRHS